MYSGLYFWHGFGSNQSEPKSNHRPMLNEMQFEKELNDVQDMVFRFALKLTGNYQDAQDLWQEACIRAFRYRCKFELGTNFKAWMSTIVQNLFITRYRRRQRKPLVNEPIETFAFALESKNMVANEGEVNLRLQVIYRQLSTLSELYSIPFLLHYQGFEYKEIAERLDLPIGTVKSRIFTARQQLKERLNKLV